MTGDSAGCNKLAAESEICNKEMNQINEAINQYNDILTACKRAEAKDRESATGKPQLEIAKRKAVVAQAKQGEFESSIEKAVQEQKSKIAGDEYWKQAAVDAQQRKQAQEVADQKARDTEPQEPSSPRSSGNAPSVDSDDSGWTCFTTYGECIRFCMQETGAEGSARWCGGVCSEHGYSVGKPPGPQRCYHAKPQS